ncbi:hypothetical protein GOBAR_AA29886 [Gossypium barbadense]|uniref:RNase H type-1 domain-containing protein n=1 Tax=Gossypium barbadense TaxID=3634 RepID=A0A2P5WI85_GOSBA|nr:hypothetical protein GOBAR_AA29886 [Gossypium barbadense]
MVLHLATNGEVQPPILLSFKASNNNGGEGVVLRDFEGFVVGAAALKLPIAANAATTVKAITAVKAIEIDINMGLSYGIIGGDTRVIMKGLNGKEHFSEIGPILDKAKFLLQ